MYKGNEKITICDHPLIKHKTTMIRNEATGTNEFRKIVEEISVLLGYEALRDLEMEEIEVKTYDDDIVCCKKVYALNG